MNRKIANIALSILIAIAFYTCNNEEEQSQVRISIENYSMFDIDTLIIYSSSHSVAYSVYDEIKTYWNLPSGFVTDKILFQDVESTLHLEAYIKGELIRGRWHYPNYPVDPVGPVFLPNGDYNFGIIECDTVNGRMVIGLL